MIVKILYYEISTQLESKFRGKLLNEEELAAYYEALQEKKKHNMKSVKILLIAMAVFFVLLTIAAIIGGSGNIGIILFTIIAPLILMGIAGYTGWYLNVGKVARRWNQLVKQYYPDLYVKYKL